MKHPDEHPEQMIPKTGWRRFFLIAAAVALLVGGGAVWWLAGGWLPFGLGAAQAVYAEFMPFPSFAPVEYRVIHSPFHEDLTGDNPTVIFYDKETLQLYMERYGITEQPFQNGAASSLLDTTDFTKQAIVVVTGYSNPEHMLLSPVVILNDMDGCMSSGRNNSLLVLSHAGPSAVPRSPEAALQGYLLAIDRSLLDSFEPRWDGLKIIVGHETNYYDFTGALAGEYEEQHGKTNQFRYDDMTTKVLADAGYRVCQYKNPELIECQTFLVPNEGIVTHLGESHARNSGGIGDIFIDGQYLIYAYSSWDTNAFIGIVPLNNTLMAQKSDVFYHGEIRLGQHWSGRWGVYADIDGKNTLLAWLTIKPDGVLYEIINEESYNMPVPAFTPSPDSELPMSTPTPVP